MTRGIHWFRSDLRLRDNSSLRALLQRVEQWLPVFVLDPRILEGPLYGTARASFLLDSVERLARELAQRDVPFVVLRGAPEEVLPKLLHETRAELLSFNAALPRRARERDERVIRAVEKSGAEVLSLRDDVVFASHEVRTQSGGPYAVYTPYRNRWWSLWEEDPRLPSRLGRVPVAIPGFKGRGLLAGRPRSRTAKSRTDDVATFHDGVAMFDEWKSRLEAERADADLSLPTGGEAAAGRRLRAFLDGPASRYAADRDLPSVDGTSRLSPYLRFGVLSPRQCFAQADEVLRADPRSQRGVSKWLDELIWREFYYAILEEHPRVKRGNYRRDFDTLLWEDDEEGFEAWCDGRTGFPIVDAGMRQLRATGWMHNRVRMIVASFLTKDLLIHWRHGERFFYEHLVDGDPATNNGGWQWASSTGTDAQPYFRIFNPTTQGKRYDPDGAYIRRWIPELANVPDRDIHTPSQAGLFRGHYPDPIVDHGEARARALDRYTRAREEAQRK